MRLQTRGVNQLELGEAVVGVAEQAGVLPDGFYATTDLETRVCLGGVWYDVENPEMGCGLVVTDAPAGGIRVRTVPMSEVEIGMRIVVGASGIQVSVPSEASVDAAFGTRDGDAPFEKPQAVLLRQVADGMRRTRADGNRLLWVAGPGVVHTGAVPALVALIGAGFVDTLFAGNALATHDIESSLYGSSLRVDLSKAQGVEHGHEHHVRALNAVRKSGSIAQAVADGTVTSGIMHALVTHGKRYVLVASVRDDGHQDRRSRIEPRTRHRHRCRRAPRAARSRARAGLPPGMTVRPRNPA